METGRSAEPGRGSLRSDALVLVFFLAMLVAFVVRERRLGLTFPISWPDEGSFLWPALAFRDRGDFFAPELHPSREILWMPPGFMVLEGMIFRVVPFSLEAARTVSACLVAATFAFLFAIVWRSRARIAHLLVLGVFLTCPIVCLVGNVARMEALVLFLVAAGFWLLDRGRVAGLAVLALAPLVHPNGLFLAVSGVAYFTVMQRRHAVARASDWAVVAGVAFAWVAYGSHVARHFDDFRTDIGAQLLFKAYVSGGPGGVLGRMLEPVVLGSAIGLAIAVWTLRRSGSRVSCLAWLASALLVQTALTAGWLYEVYAAFAALLVSMLVVEAVGAPLDASGTAPRFRTGILAAACVAVLLVDVAGVLPSKFLARSIEGSALARPAGSPAYFTANDRAAVADYLKRMRAARPLTYVQFVPDAEGLDFESLRSNRLRYLQPTAHQFRPDVVILHESTWLPEGLRGFEFLNAIQIHAGQPPPAVTTIRARDGTERWTAYQWKMPGEP
jgi:hypothetical protein